MSAPYRTIRTPTPPVWSRDRTLYQVNVRQFTPEGTFRALGAHLPRLRELGVGILWLLPIHPIGRVGRKGTLGSYYAIRDYRAINPEHGSVRDFDSLVRRAHQLDMKLLLDWVANHTAWDHPWLRHHPEHYRRGEQSEVLSPVPGWTDVAQLEFGPDAGLPPPRSHARALWEEMISSMEHWIQRHDIDGFRCDVASFVPLRFWQEARRRLGRRKELFWLAESDEARMHDRAFHATYGWTLQRGLREVAAERINATELERRLVRDLRAYPEDAFRMQMTSNHDVNSWDGTEFQTLGAVGARAGAVLSFLFPGIPSIYSGQEAGNPRRLAFFEKDEIAWRPHRAADLYARLISLRRRCPLLWSGSAGAPLRFLKSGDSSVLAFVREDERGSLLAVFRLANGDGAITLSPRPRHSMTHMFGTDRARARSEDGFPIEISARPSKVQIHLGPWGYGAWSSFKG